MEPLALNANKLALALWVSASGVYEIMREERDIPRKWRCGLVAAWGGVLSSG
jgi:hypothetical protein